ncbi:MAG: M23 family metallopeptidase [Acetobacteraceae bacterium]|nr:M23 family metallopeptidase [Acetobacteraceae bacterium]
MSLGAALLQPQVLRRGGAFDGTLALAEDVARLAALLIEDAAAGGAMAAQAEVALADRAAALAASFAPRLRAAEARLRGLVTGPRQVLEGLAAEAEALAQDPAAVLGLMRRLLELARTLVDGASLPAIRAALGVLKALVEEDLGLSAAALRDMVLDFLDAWSARIAALPEPLDAAARRRRRLVRTLLARLRAQGSLLTPPGFEVEPLARAIDRLLTESGARAALRDLGCALDGVAAALDAAIAAGGAVRQAAPLPVGAGVVPLSSSAEYSWYASWLLNDEDMPMLGLSDIDKPAEFLTQLKSGTGPLEARLREAFQPAELQALNGFTGSGEPPRDLMLTVLAAVNRQVQTTELLFRAGEDQILPDSALDERTRDLKGSFQKDQSLHLFNRRLLEHVFGDKIDTLGSGFFHGLGQGILGVVGYPRNQVIVTGDRRFVMCDDKPIHSGENVEWHQAPIFSQATLYSTWFSFEKFGPRGCEIFAQVLFAAAEAGKAIWHLVKTQPGHEAQAASVGAIEIADTIQMILFGKPLSGYFLEGGPDLRRWGKSLDSAVGLKGIATFASTFQGLQSDAPNEKFKFWITVLMGDIFRTLGPIQTINALRDLLLGGMTLLNFGGPQDGPSTLPSNPARNHLKQAPVVAVSDTLFAMLLISLYPRDNYSIFLFDPGEEGIGDRRLEAFLGHWLGGSAGLGLAAGLTGSLVAQILAWAEDVPRFFLTGAKSAGKMFGLYWLFWYAFKENATDGGRYRPLGGSFRGYPDKERAPSPYRLPFPGGTAQYTGQANLGLFSHNAITNTDFVTPANSATQQTYAYDFGHDFRQAIACSRAGVVWSFNEGVADSSTATANRLIIRHATIDPEHDDFGQGPVQTYAVYLHLAQNGVTGAPRFGGTAPVQESATPGGGTPVAQGDLIALAGDTGMSFHNHLHMHVLPDDGTGQPDTTFAIPFVFEDAPGDGNLKSTTWYRSGNA